MGKIMVRLSILSSRLTASFLALCLGSALVLAQEAPKKDEAPAEKAKAPESSAPKPGNVGDPADLEPFFDGVLNVQLESKHIAGAVVAVVVDDKVVFMKGYGYSDIDARRKVDPEKTMFRIASISKLFIWTSVMQQVEAGKIDLDTDVNKYMKDVQIPQAFDKPVTMKNLLTHTPGFEDYVLGLFAHKREEIRPLPEVLNAQMPSRVRAPGMLSSYSNHGTAMAGYAVACVSGQSWEEYVEQHILKPLGMEHTMLRQPPTDELAADLSKGYKWEGGRFKAQDFEYIPAAPAGCISTTAADIAKFMIAHLNDGQLGSGRILKAETAHRMREPLFRHDPKVSAMCYGFMEQQRNGQRMVGHGGDTFWFHSLMQLIPDRRVGLFVSYNTDTSSSCREVLLDAFLRRYFPEPDPPRVPAPSDFKERAQRVAGEYGFTRHSHTTMAKLGALLGTLKVSVNDDNTLSIGTLTESRRYVEIEPMVYRELDGPGKVVFHEEDNGKNLQLFIADAPPIAAIRRPWYETSTAQWGVFAGSLLIFLTALLFWPVIAFSLRGLGSTYIRRTRFSGFLSVVAWLLAAVSIGWVIAIGVILREPTDIAYGVTPLLQKFLAVPQVIAVLAGITVLGCLVAWVNSYWRFTGRVHYTLVALAGAGFIYFLYHWNLLTFGFKDVLS
jgi:CubicO group peptidase (beta-lactamase class C family)